MTATATTIRDVSILSGSRRRGHADRFDIELSARGIEIRRPGRAPQHMSWARVTQWEIEERAGHLVLTLRGSGAVTPLVVQGWTLDDLEVVMRQATEGSAAPAQEHPAASAAQTETVAGPQTAAGAETAAETSRPEAEGAVADVGHRPRRHRQRSGRGWKPFVTVALLALLATAVTVVLLQSAGLIHWGFLGPVA